MAKISQTALEVTPEKPQTKGFLNISHVLKSEI